MLGFEPVSGVEPDRFPPYQGGGPPRDPNRRACFAEAGGLEPPFTGPKPVVFPLDDASMVPPTGLEPAHLGVKARCSAAERTGEWWERQESNLVIARLRAVCSLILLRSRSAPGPTRTGVDPLRFTGLEGQTDTEAMAVTLTVNGDNDQWNGHYRGERSGRNSSVSLTELATRAVLHAQFTLHVVDPRRVERLTASSSERSLHRLGTGRWWSEGIPRPRHLVFHTSALPSELSDHGDAWGTRTPDEFREREPT